MRNGLAGCCIVDSYDWRRFPIIDLKKRRTFTLFTTCRTAEMHLPWGSSIDFEQFLESGVSLVECPDCTSTSALAPHKEILHFKPHKRRKTRSTSTEPRWAKREMIWAVVSK